MNVPSRSPAARGQPAATPAEVETPVRRTVCAGVFTTAAPGRDGGAARRGCADALDACPAAGEKPMRRGARNARVKGRRETFVTDSVEEIGAALSGRGTIRPPGRESRSTPPIVVAGWVAGTPNRPREADLRAPERADAASSLGQSGASAPPAAGADRQGGT